MKKTEKTCKTYMFKWKLAKTQCYWKHVLRASQVYNQPRSSFPARNFKWLAMFGKVLYLSNWPETEVE